MLLRADDTCAYDSDNNGSRDANWAIDWQNTHTQDLDWYHCISSHTQPLNANQKAYAAWWLWATLAGWNSSGSNRSPTLLPIGDQSVQCGQLLQFTAHASDLDSGDVLTFSANPLPGNATFDSGSRAFSWTPASYDSGDHQVTFRVVDNGSPQGQDQETITISVGSGGSNNNVGTSNDGGSSGCLIDSLLLPRRSPKM